jgi:carbamoyl-phosphate synthase large subunit
MRILVTGANAPGSSGTAYSLRQSHFLDEVPKLYGSDELPLAFNPLFEKVSQLPNGNAVGYERAIERLCRKEQIDLVIPQTTAENSYFTRTVDKKRDYAISVLRSRKSKINLNSKIQTYEFIKQLGVADDDFEICHTFDQLADFQRKNSGATLFLKADELSGGRGVVKVVPELGDALLKKAQSFHVVDKSQLEKIFYVLNTGSGVIAQLEAVGREFSIDCFRGENISISVPRTRDIVRSGVSQQTTVTKSEILIKFANLFGEALGLEGIYGLQCILTAPNKFSFLECNPRIQGTMVASTIAGENIIARGARLALNLPQIPEKCISWGTVYRRTWSGFGFHGNSFYEI